MQPPFEQLDSLYAFRKEVMNYPSRRGEKRVEATASARIASTQRDVEQKLHARSLPNIHIKSRRN
jgi:hypothetical protein